MDDDYLFLGHELRFSGEAEDLLFLGKELDFSGKARLGLLALGKEVQYSGEVGNGIIAGCKDIVIDAPAKGNSYIGCKALHLTSKGAIEGDLFAGCAELLVEGPIHGNLRAGTGKLVINNEINGNVTAYGGRIIIKEQGKINGDLIYSSSQKLTEEELSRVAGTVELREKEGCGDKEAWSDAGDAFKLLFGLGLFFSFVVVGCLLLFIPAFDVLDKQRSGRAFWKTGLWGLIPLLMYPAIVVICFVMVITIPLAVILILAALPLFFVACLMGTTMTGRTIATRFKWNVTKKQYHFLIGALAVGILSVLPLVNFLTFLFVSALGFGVFLSAILKKDLVELNGDDLNTNESIAQGDDHAKEANHEM